MSRLRWDERWRWLTWRMFFGCPHRWTARYDTFWKIAFSTCDWCKEVRIGP